MITIRNKRTGEVKTVPRSQYVDDNGLKGIQSDIESSAKTAIPALGEMLQSLPGAINKVGHYATTTNPVSTLANLGAGGVEGAAGLLSSPQKLMRYLAEKFPAMGEALERGKFQGQGVNDPTLFEGLTQFENEHGLAPQNEEEAAVRGAGNLLFGGAGLTKLPNMMTRAGAVGAQQGGMGGDPVHGALLGALGEMLARAPWKKAPGAMRNIAQATPDAIRQIPQLTANMGQSIGAPMSGAFEGLPSYTNKMLAHGLESLAEKTKMLPIIPEKLLEMSYKRKFKEYDPEELARKELFGDITQENLPQVEERVAAARRLGLSFLTPGEALLSPFQSRKEANVGHSIKGEKLLYSKGENRAGSEERAIENLLDTIYDKNELSKDKQAAYDNAMQSTVSPEFIERWKQDPVVEAALDKIKTTPTYKRAVRSYPEDSFRYWDVVKRVIADMEKEDVKGMKKFSSDQATMARNEMVDEMDAINPSYESARNISEREFTRKDLEDVFDKKDMTLNNFWSLLKSDKKFDKLMRKLSDFPEAQQKLRDIRLLSNDLIPFDESIRSAYKLEKTGMYKERNKLDALRRALTQQHGEAHDVAQVNLMTDPRMLELLKEYLSRK